jgi:hypothetical protein
MDPNAQPISPFRFETGFLQEKGEADRIANRTYDPNAGGLLDGGKPYGDDKYPPQRRYDEAEFFDARYIQKYNDLLGSLRASKGVGVPEDFIPEGIG